MSHFEMLLSAKCLHKNRIPAEMAGRIKCGHPTNTHQISLLDSSPDNQGAALCHLGHPIPDPLLHLDRDEPPTYRSFESRPEISFGYQRYAVAPMV